MALTAAGCRRPEQKVFPAVIPVESTNFGEFEYYNTALSSGNALYRLSIKLFEGKPVFVSPNNDFAANRAVSEARISAELYNLYNPKRFFKPVNAGVETDLASAMAVATERIGNALNSGENVVFAVDYSRSLSLLKMITAITEQYPNTHFIDFDKNIDLSKYSNLLKINLVNSVDLSKIDYILSLNEDIFGASEYSQYLMEKIDFDKCQVSVVSDCELASCCGLIDSGIELKKYYQKFVSDLKIYVLGEYIGNNNPAKYSKYVAEVGEKLKRAKNPLIIYGANDYQMINVSNLCINELKKTLDSVTIVDLSSDSALYKCSNSLNYYVDSAKCFVDCQDIINRKSSKVRKALKNKADNIDCVRLTYYNNPSEIKGLITIPKAHFLETWSDGLSLGGDYAIQQPVINKLNANSLSGEELIYLIYKQLGVATLQKYNDYYEFVKSELNDEKLFEETIVNTIKYNHVTMCDMTKELSEYPADNLVKTSKVIALNSNNKIRLIPRANPNIRTYEDYMNPWLRELKNPLTSIAYYNILEINAITANQYQLNQGDWAKISDREDSAELPIAINNNMPDNIIVSDLNYGYENSQYSGANINKFQKDNYNSLIPVRLEKVDKPKVDLQYNFNKIAELQLNYLKKIKEIDNFTIHKNYTYLDKHWGLIVDIDACTGCNACVVACKVENNIPTVGANNVEKSRDMDWITILKSTTKSGKQIYIPYMCQHCENAPCETACPVNAATHSPEGLSETVYNRCVGTRYCMAACQYKVRKFNFVDYFAEYPKELSAGLNPRVTVRSRGVVEKCSLCVQRLNEYNAQNEDEQKLGLPKTACSEACPRNAIKLVDLNSTETRQYLKENEDKIYQIVFNSSNKPSVYYLLSE